MTSKEAFNKLQHYINGTKLSGEEYLECCKILDKGLERLEELEEQVAALDNSVNNLALDLDISREENSKLKKAIDILKCIYDIQYIIELDNGNYGIVNIVGDYIEVEKEKAIALKEVFEE